ncbi:MAG TPA: hypothetical protein ENN55_00070 [Firmicutes bacterium]|nr:hypothetical protein [Bacillota bacterium]
MKSEAIAKSTEISNEEKELLMLNDKFGRKAAEGHNRQFSENSKTIRIDSALKRLYMTLILRSF